MRHRTSSCPQERLVPFATTSRYIEHRRGRKPLSADAGRDDEGEGAGGPLFDYQPKGWRPNTNPTKARIDGLLRRVRQLCQEAGVPEVMSHSMRGLNAPLRTLGGSSHQAIADALGHESFTTTSRYCLDPAAAEEAASRRSHGRLLSAA